MGYGNQFSSVYFYDLNLYGNPLEMPPVKIVIQGKALTIHPDENSRTGWAAQLLKAKGYTVEEQVPWGQSSTGKRLGELDLMISDRERRTFSIAEAFNLSCLDRTKILEFVEKIFGYDRRGGNSTNLFHFFIKMGVKPREQGNCSS